MFKVLTDEFKVAHEKYSVWSYLSVSDIKNKFRRSKFGVAWSVIQQLAFSLGAGFIWSTVFHLDPGDFIPFLTMGFALWGFMSAAMLEGCSTFVISHGYLKQLPLPQSIFILRTLMTQLIFLGIAFLTALVILLFYGKLNLLGLLLSLPGISILIIFGYSCIGSLAYLGLRYRDIQHGLTGILSLLFVVTPVIYPAEILIEKGVGFAVYGNPFASLIEIVRYPILNNEFASVSHYIMAIIFTLGLTLLRFYFASIWGRFVPFWS